MIEIWQVIDECGVPSYSGRCVTRTISDCETEEEAYEAVGGHMIDCKGKRFFISGPMSGIPLNNVPKFTRVHAWLKVNGAERVFDPAHNWLDETGPDKSHEHYMYMCLRALLESRWDYVVMLEGWDESGGATIEHDVAMACGYTVIGEGLLGIDQPTLEGQSW